MNYIPQSCKQAIEWLRPVVDASVKDSMATLSDRILEQGLNAIAFLYGGLHPDNLAHGKCDSEGSQIVNGVTVEHYNNTRLLPFCSECGWPNLLRPVVEAIKQRKTIDLYAAESATAGLRYMYRHPTARFA